MRTALAVPALQVFPAAERDGVVVTLSDWIEPDVAGDAHRGLLVDVALAAPDPRAVLRQGFVLAERIVGLVTFASAAAAGPIEPLIGYRDADPGDGCDVLQVEVLPAFSSARRMLRQERVAVIVGRFNAIDDDDRERITRGIDWYRAAINERLIADRFSAGWIGLEAINPLLKRRHGLPKEQATRLCPNCKTPVVLAQTSAGIKDLVVRNFEADTWKRTHDYRQVVLHATRPLREVTADGPACAATVIESLRRGLLELIDATPAEIEDLKGTPMLVPEPTRVELTYQMRPLRARDIPFGPGYPRIALKRLTGTRTREAEGVTREGFTHDWELRNFAGQVPSPLGIAMRVSSDPDAPRRRIEISNGGIYDKATGELIAPMTATPVDR